MSNYLLKNDPDLPSSKRVLNNLIMQQTSALEAVSDCEYVYWRDDSKFSESGTPTGYNTCPICQKKQVLRRGQWHQEDGRQSYDCQFGCGTWYGEWEDDE